MTCSRVVTTLWTLTRTTIIVCSTRVGVTWEVTVCATARLSRPTCGSAPLVESLSTGVARLQSAVSESWASRQLLTFRIRLPWTILSIFRFRMFKPANLKPLSLPEVMCEWPKQYVGCGPACHDICGVKTCKTFTGNECFEQCACPEGLVENEHGKCAPPQC